MLPYCTHCTSACWIIDTHLLMFAWHFFLLLNICKLLNFPSLSIQIPKCRAATQGTSWVWPECRPKLANGRNSEGTWSTLRGLHWHVWQRSDLPQGWQNLDWADFQPVSEQLSINVSSLIASLFRDNTYGLDRNVPIPQATILTVNSSGHTINSWGQGLFFLPHMITVDKQNNVWVTDVALHQVRTWTKIYFFSSIPFRERCKKKNWKKT